jgi:hypothetical protein
MLWSQAHTRGGGGARGGGGVLTAHASAPAAKSASVSAVKNNSDGLTRSAALTVSKGVLSLGTLRDAPACTGAAESISFTSSGVLEKLTRRLLWSPGTTFRVWTEFTASTGKRSELPRGMPLVTRVFASSEHAWDPMASSSVNFCRKTRTVLQGH